MKHAGLGNLMQKYIPLIDEKATIDSLDLVEDFLHYFPQATEDQIMAFAEHLKNEGCKLKNANIFSQGNTHETLEDRIMEEEEEDARSETNDENPLGSSSVSLLIRDLERHPLLSPRRELEVAKAAAEGDSEALNELIVSNIRLVIDMAKRYQSQGLDLEDLISEGCIGLMRAAQKFEYTKGFRFSTYAYWWIKQGISRAIHDKSRTIRLPSHVHESLNRIASFARQYEVEKGEPPNRYLIAEALNLSAERVSDLLVIAELHRLNMPSLDSMVRDDGDSVLVDFVEDKTVSVEELVLDGQLRSDLYEALKALKPREREVLTLRFGLEDQVPRTLEAVGENYGVTRERIRQIEAKAFRRLRTNRCLKEYLE